MTRTADCIVIGAGIAGASVGFFLAPHRRCCCSSASRSRAITPPAARRRSSWRATARRRCAPSPWRAAPSSRRRPRASPSTRCSAPRGAMMVASHGQEAPLHEHWEVLQPISPRGRLLDAADACALVPVLRREQVIGAVYEPDASDMDVHAIHQGYLRGIRRAGGALLGDAPRDVAAARAAASGRCRPARTRSRRRWWSTPPAPGPTRSARSPAPGRSASSRGAARPSSSRRPTASPAPPGR